MALLWYMKPSRSCLPDPRGSMSVPSQAIAEANKDVQKAMQATKLGPSWCEIARNTPDTTEQQQQRGTTLETTSKLEKQFLVDGDGVSVFLDSYCVPILYVSWLPARLPR